MSTFAILVVILGVLSGLINFAIGLMRRNHLWVAVMRFGAGLVSFAAAGAAVYAKTAGLHLPASWHSTEYTIFLFMALAIFVGGTLYLPATIERNVLPVAETAPVKTATTLTGKLAGDPGVRIANNNVGGNNTNEEWVN